MSARIAVVGAGIFGVTAAIELRARGHHVRLFDPGPLPHPLAASTDVSKAIRADYGPDVAYTALMERALDGWRAWNEAWRRSGRAPLFHETGVTYLTRHAMAPSEFEHDSYDVLRSRGHRLERLDAAAIHARFPAWNADRFVDGYYNPHGGFAESGAVVARLLEDAVARGVEVHEGVSFAALRHAPGDEQRVTGFVAQSGDVVDADVVIVALGAWTARALPKLAGELRTLGQPVFHLRPDVPARFEAPRFPPFGADIAATGYYGFPLQAGVVKIARHGPGRAMDPSDLAARVVLPEEERHLRAFLREAFPELAAAPIALARICVYCDTNDEHFWIARDPAHAGLVVATGGSGHAFKFAPILGALIADAVEGGPNPALVKFRWRQGVRPERGEEAARNRG